MWHIPLCLRLDGAFRRIPSDAFARARLRDAVRFIGGLLADAGENRAHDTAHLVLCIGHFLFRFDVSKEHCGHPAAQPVMQLIELLRQSLSRGYVAPTYDYLYIVAFCVVSLCLGGLLERYARKRAEQ